MSSTKPKLHSSNFSATDQYALHVTRNLDPPSILGPDLLNLLSTLRTRIQQSFEGNISTNAHPLFEENDRILNKLIDDEKNKLCNNPNNLHPPKLAWFLCDLQRILIDQVLQNSHSTDQLHKCNEKIDCIHSQQLALLLYPTINDSIKRYFPEESSISLVDIGAKNGDCLARINHELDDDRIHAEAFDLEPEQSILERLSLQLDLPSISPILVKQGNILRLGKPKQDGVLNAPADIILLSNILHKLDSNDHLPALKSIADNLSNGGLLLLNTPYFNRNGHTAPLENFYKTCDTTEHPNSILSWEDWKKTVENSGLSLVGEVNLNDQASLLDGFFHRLLIAQKQ